MSSTGGFGFGMLLLSFVGDKSAWAVSMVAVESDSSSHLPGGLYHEGCSGESVVTGQGVFCSWEGGGGQGRTRTPALMREARVPLGSKQYSVTFCPVPINTHV